MEVVVSAIEKLPNSDFIYTRALFWNAYMVPDEFEDIQIVYNNHIPKAGLLCHSASIYNLKSSFGQFVLDDLKKYDKIADHYNGLGVTRKNYKISLKYKTLHEARETLHLYEKELDPADLRCIIQLYYFKHKYDYKTLYVHECAV